MAGDDELLDLLDDSIEAIHTINKSGGKAIRCCCSDCGGGVTFLTAETYLAHCADRSRRRHPSQP
jgi:hypothetical protein